MARILALFAFATLLVVPAACSSETDGERAGKSPRGGATQGEATVATGRATVAEGGPKTPGRLASWDYVALGDSLAAGVGARRGYVDRYAEHLRAGTGARVSVENLGVSGQTSAQLLRMIRGDASVRRAIRGAEVITFNIGINDLGHARGSYEAETCGGLRNQRCLRTAVETLGVNWDAISREILALRPTDETIIRTAGLGYTPRVGGVSARYLERANRHIAASTSESGIPYTKLSLGDDGLSSDGLHPDDSGYEAIADHLGDLGYEPLGGR